MGPTVTHSFSGLSVPVVVDSKVASFLRVLKNDNTLHRNFRYRGVVMTGTQFKKVKHLERQLAHDSAPLKKKPAPWKNPRLKTTMSCLKCGHVPPTASRICPECGFKK